MNLGWYKIYYNAKCKIHKNHEGQENYAIIKKRL